MKALFSTLCIAIVSLAAHAQTASVHGRVVSAADSIALAGVSVFMQGNKAVATHTDAKGFFELKGVPAGEVDIVFDFQSFRQRTVKVAVKAPRTEMGDVRLRAATNRIEEIVVTAKAPMAQVKGDTVQYNADAFKTRPDADVEELVVKMPGVIIQQGRIEAQGEPVRRIYVDGKLFFGSDPMAALKSLPADAVESIQLFDAPSEESRLTGFDDGSTEKAINIVTKAKMHESTILKAETAGGMETAREAGDPLRYLAGGNFSRFTPEQRFTVSLLSNNVNTRKFGEPELAGDSETDANGNIRNQPMGVQNINGAGFNYTRENEKLKLETSLSADHTVNHTITHAENNYYPDDRYWQKSSISDNEYFTHTLNGRFNLRAEWRPSKTNTLVFAPRLTLRDTHFDSRGSGVLNIQNGDSLSRTRTFSPYDNSSLALGGEMLWTHRFAKNGRRLTLSLTLSNTAQDNDQYKVDSLRQTYKDGQWVDKAGDNRYIYKTTDNSYFKAKAIWTEPFLKYHRLMANYSFRHDWGSVDGHNDKYDPATGEYSIPDSQGTDIYRIDYNTHAGGVGYALYTKVVSVNAGVDYQVASQHREEVMPTQSVTDRSFGNFTPMVSLKYSIQKKRYLRLRYQGRPQLPNIAYMQDVLNYANPNHLYQGNPGLRPSYNNSLEAFYNATNVERNTNFTLTLRASAIADYIATQNEILSGDEALPVYPGSTETYTPLAGATLTRRVNIDGYAAADAAATYSFFLSPIKSNLNLSGQYTYTRVPSYIRDRLNVANINSIGARVGVTSNISRNVDFNVYSNTAWNRTVNSEKEDNSFLNQNFFYSVNVIFWKGFVFNSVLSWRYYTSSSAEDMNTSFWVLNASLGKKVFKRQNGEVSLAAYDLLDQNTNRLHYVRDTYVQDLVTNTLGRYATLRFSYRFNSLSMPRKGAIEIKNAHDISVKEVKKISNDQKKQAQQ